MIRFSSIINLSTVLAILLVSVFVEDSLAQESEARVWKTTNGKYSVEAVLLGVKDGKVRLKRSDNGKIAVVPIIKLSDADREYLTSLAKGKESSPTPEEPAAENSAAKDGGSNESQLELDKPKTKGAKTDEAKKKQTKTVPNSQTPSNDPPPRMENPTAEAQPIPTGNKPPKDNETPAVEQAELKTGEAQLVNPIGPPSETSSNSNETEDQKNSGTNPEVKGELSKPIVPFRSGNSQRNKPDMDSNEGVVKTNETPPSSAESSDESKSTRDASSLRSAGSAKPKRTVGKIDPANVSVEAIAGDDRLKTIDENKLVDSLHLRAELAWKGTVKLNHLLETRKPNFELVIFAENSTALDSAINIGHVTVAEMIDPDGNTFAPTIFPPSVVNPRKHWVKVDGQRVNRYVSAEVAGNSAVVAVEYDRPARMPQKMSVAKGDFKISFATDVQRITLKNVEKNQGRLESPILGDNGLSVVVRQPDSVTLVVEFSGDVHRVASIKTNQRGLKKVALLKAVSRNRGFAQFNFRKAMENGTDLELEIVTETRDLTVPFEFRDVQFNLPDTKTDATAG